MVNTFEPFQIALEQFELLDAIDIIIMAVIIYALIRIISQTRAMRVVIGLVVILIFAWIADLMNLVTVTWMFSWILQASAVFIVILFQPEIRRALEKLGRGRMFNLLRTTTVDLDRLIEPFSKAILNMSKQRVGALIVFERKTGLADVVESGTLLDADPSSNLIENIFYPNTPLHDGAMVVRDGRITAAGCFLPLSDNQNLSSELGTRHRAAIGVSEVSDAYVIVVSEERGTISLAYDGALQQHLDAKRLKDILSELFITPKKGLNKKDKNVDLSAQTKEIDTEEIVRAEKKAKEHKRSSSKKGGRKK